MEKYCLAVDLVDNPDLIKEYEHWHKPEKRRPEIMQSIKDAGITNMEIYRTGNRLFMIMETDETFSFKRKTALDTSNEKVQEWEQFVWKFQQPLPWAQSGEKWVLMDKIFELNKS